jgi:hypothetical protein
LQKSEFFAILQRFLGFYRNSEAMTVFSETEPAASSSWTTSSPLWADQVRVREEAGLAAQGVGWGAWSFG